MGSAGASVGFGRTTEPDHAPLDSHELSACRLLDEDAPEPPPTF
ncbi:hypothetical protein ACF08N_03320 [Streptomyces sp. NPDC015127]